MPEVNAVPEVVGNTGSNTGASMRSVQHKDVMQEILVCKEQSRVQFEDLMSAMSRGEEQKGSNTMCKDEVEMHVHTNSCGHGGYGHGGFDHGNGHCSLMAKLGNIQQEVAEVAAASERALTNIMHTDALANCRDHGEIKMQIAEAKCCIIANADKNTDKIMCWLTQNEKDNLVAKSIKQDAKILALESALAAGAVAGAAAR